MNNRFKFQKIARYLIVFASICASCVAIAPDQLNQLGFSSNTAQDLPLVVDNAWVYQRTRYAGFYATKTMTATSIVTETVVDIAIEGDYVVATIRRDKSAEWLISEDIDAFTPEKIISSSNYWLVIDSDRVYRQKDELDLTGIKDSGEMELVFPLEVGEKWYLDHGMAEVYPNKTVDSMLRKVQRIEKVEVPAGQFEGCFYMEEIIGGSTFERSFCPGIGWVDQRSDHHGTPSGWREVLLEYHLN